MNKYKITYWFSGNILVCEMEADSTMQALYMFYMRGNCDDVISIELMIEV